MKTLVAFGCSTTPDYSFIAPIAALFWRDLIGHEPRVYLIGTDEEWTKGKEAVVAEASRQHSYVEIVPRVGVGWSEGSLAQSIRQHAACDPHIADDTWVMMSDADLLPLKRDFYHQHENTDRRATFLYSNGDHHQGKEITLQRFDNFQGFQSLPTCHMILHARDWRTMYDLTPGDIGNNLERTLDKMTAWLARCTSDPNMAKWCADQWWATERVCRQDWFPHDALLVPRAGHPPPDRLDREFPEHWVNFDPNRWTDAHVHRQPWNDTNWPMLLGVIDRLLPQHSTWAREYREAFVTKL